MSSKYGLAESPSGVGIVAPNTYVLVSNGDGTWSPAAQGGGGGAVNSVFGRLGTVVAVAGDYNATKVTNDSSVAGATVKDALNTLGTNRVTSVFGRTGAVVGVLNDYTGAQIDNVSSVAGATVDDALFTLSQSDGIDNLSNVDGATVTAALNTLNGLYVSYTKTTQNPFAPFVAPGLDITVNPLPAGLYSVAASVTTLSTNTAGAFTTSFTCRDQSGTMRTKLLGANLTTDITNTTGTVVLESNGADPIRLLNVVTTPFVGDVSVQFRISVQKMGN